MKNDLLVLETPELSVIEESKAEKIKATFEPMAKMLTGFEQYYNEIIVQSKKEITPELCSDAKRLRLDIGKIRIETGKLKDKQKEYIKLEDRAIMGVHNILVWAVKEKEDNLKEIENHYEIQERKRLKTLQADRVEKLSKYLEDAHERNLSDMDEDVWKAYFNAKKQEFQDRVEAEKKAEADRVAHEKAEAEERKRIAKENEQLKKAAEENERLAKIEAEKRAKIENERKAKEEIERKQREEKAKKEREAFEAKIDAERKEKERIEKEEKAKRDKLEAELKAKEDAERKAAEDEEKRVQAELNKGDAAKVKDLIADLEKITKKYVFKSAKNKKMYSGVTQLINKVILFIDK